MLAYLCVVLLGSACANRTAHPTFASDVHRTGAVEIVKSDRVISETAYTVIERLVKDPRILEKSWPEMRPFFPRGCVQQKNSPDLVFPPIPGLLRLSVTASGEGIIDAVFSSDCVSFESLCDTVRKRLGSCDQNNCSRSAAQWDLSPWVKRGNLRIHKGKKNPDTIFFQMAIEQGP